MVKIDSCRIFFIVLGLLAVAALMVCLGFHTCPAD